VTDERRVFQRLHLTEPIDGWFGDFAVQLLDVSATGARIRCDDEIDDGARALLRFFWRRDEIELMAETVRRVDGHCGLAFTEQNETLLKVLAEQATELLIAQEANARGDRDRNVVGDSTITSVTSFGGQGYVVWTLLESGAWKCRRAMIPDQPPEGFTVSAGEPEEQVELLCRTYEAGDAEARRMTRLLAELSVAVPR
jgi:hypothetical protein